MAAAAGLPDAANLSSAAAAVTACRLSIAKPKVAMSAMRGTCARRRRKSSGEKGAEYLSLFNAADSTAQISPLHIAQQRRHRAPARTRIAHTQPRRLLSRHVAGCAAALKDG